MISWKDTENYAQQADVFGEGIMSSPPEPYVPLVDSEFEEKAIWLWHKDFLNQPVMPFKQQNANETMNMRPNPYWARKFSAPAWYDENKLGKLARHNFYRAELENLKAEYLSV